MRGIATVAAGAMTATTCAFAEVAPSVCAASGCAGDIVVGIQAAFVPSWLPAVDQAGQLAGFVEHPTTNLEIAIGIENPTDQPLRLTQNPIAQVAINQPRTFDEETRVLAGTVSPLRAYAIDSPALPLEVPPRSTLTLDRRTIPMAELLSGGDALLVQAAVSHEEAGLVGTAVERIALPESLPPLELSAAAPAPALDQDTSSIASAISQSGDAPVSPGDPSNDGGVPGGATGSGAGATNGNGSNGFSISMGRNGNVRVTVPGIGPVRSNIPTTIALTALAVAVPVLAIPAMIASFVMTVVNNFKTIVDVVTKVVDVVTKVFNTIVNAITGNNQAVQQNQDQSQRQAKFEENLHIQINQRVSDPEENMTEDPSQTTNMTDDPSQTTNMTEDPGICAAPPDSGGPSGPSGSDGGDGDGGSGPGPGNAG